MKISALLLLISYASLVGCKSNYDDVFGDDHYDEIGIICTCDDIENLDGADTIGPSIFQELMQVDNVMGIHGYQAVNDTIRYFFDSHHPSARDEVSRRMVQLQSGLPGACKEIELQLIKQH